MFSTQMGVCIGEIENWDAPMVLGGYTDKLRGDASLNKTKMHRKTGKTDVPLKRKIQGSMMGDA